MSERDITKNPFAALFPSPEDAKNFRNLQSQIELSAHNKDKGKSQTLGNENNVQQSSLLQNNNLTKAIDKFQFNSICEDVFRITLNKDSVTRPKSCLYLSEVSSALQVQLFDSDNLEQVIFERLMIDDPSKFLITSSDAEDDDYNKEKAIEKRIIYYLFDCYFRLKVHHTNLLESDSYILASVIISDVSTALCHPEFFSHSNPHTELIDLLIENHMESGKPDVLSSFLIAVSDNIKNKFEIGEDEIDLKSAFSPSFHELAQRLLRISVVDCKMLLHIGILQYFTKSVNLSLAMIEYSIPSDLGSARAYQSSLLGAPLSISCLPRKETDGYDFFNTPSLYSAQEHSITEQNLWMPLSSIAEEMYHIFYNLLRQSPETKHKLLTWIGCCLQANNDRAKLWNNQLPEIFGIVQSSDGFMLNFGAVLLKLCSPFSQPFSPKLLKINPTYCAARALNNEDARERSIHLKDLNKETFVIPSEENELPDVRNTKYNFPTECFFATHRALALGFHVVHERLVKLSQELGRIQRVYEEARIQGGESADVVQRIKENMDKGMTKFLSVKAALLEPQTLDSMLKFHIATATWLINVATNFDHSQFKSLTLPLQSEVPCHLRTIPEFIIENIADCVLFIHRFSSKTFEISGAVLDHLITLVLVFMGSPERMKNPHMRARLSELLEALMPAKEGEHYNTLIPCVYRERLFKEHPYISELVPTLLHVFVSIEMTGQSVAFEEKFQYRRPMYLVLDYIWGIDVHKEKMKQLAKEAEELIESAHPPLFLRFINLLINDAIFLLDEALSYMSKLREQQQQRDNGEWASLPSMTRQQNEANFQHMGLLARFHNVMSNETIHTLQWLTSEITSIFCHPTIVDRITAMLNYFLLNLVGPQKKNFKVKDLREYEFKPQELVRDICRIYLHLGSRDTKAARAFNLAVSRDGRSYSEELFPQAHAVLLKIGQVVLATKLDELAAKVRQLAIEQSREEETMEDAPDEFLDPIMNTVMRDPVRLPSSGIYVDRATIARHLLSDQTDPFNRSPLTMDNVQPAEELKARIEQWLSQKRGV
ncbi:ubiquitin conjugation factor E4 A [Centruroides vittatus]|uniref:ubiquitin conjugation factor E4 A n=1 Tax=Centruroides vittatus TaxID=120091 RepID=UPI0035108EAB